eukprot:1118056-Rhodomonas_salina.1
MAEGRGVRSAWARAVRAGIFEALRSGAVVEEVGGDGELSGGKWGVGGGLTVCFWGREGRARHGQQWTIWHGR